MDLNFEYKLHSDIIRQCSKEVTMENCEDFVKLQAIFCTANDFVKKFEHIIIYDGNEHYINEISKRTENYLKRMGYIQEIEKTIIVLNEDRIRILVWFFIVNTNCSYKFQLEEENNLSPCLNMLPPLTKCLTVAMIWKLSLDNFLYEIISYTPTWFIFQWSTDIVQSLRSMNLFVRLKRVKFLIVAFISNISRFDYFDLVEHSEKQAACTKLVDLVAALLNESNTVIGKINNFSTLKKHKYYGYIVLYLLEITQNMINIMLVKPDFNLNAKYQLYNVLEGKNKSAQFKVNLSKYSVLIENTLKELCNTILNTLENIIMLVDTAMFINWYEIEFPDPKSLEDDYTLQNMVSDTTYTLIELNKKTFSLTHDVFNKLCSFQGKKKNYKNIVKQFNMGQLMEKLENNDVPIEIRSVLIDEFTSKNIIYNNEECLETLKNCLNFLNIDQVLTVITLANEENMEDENIYILSEIFDNLVKRMCDDELIKILLNYPQGFKYGFKNIRCNSNIEDMIYESKSDNKIILRTIVKNPYNFLSIAINIVSNRKKLSEETLKLAIDKYLKCLTLIRPTFHLISEIMLDLWNPLISFQHQQTEYNSIVYFFVEIYKLEVLEKQLFVKEFIINNIGNHKDHNFTIRIINTAEILNKILDLDDIPEHLPPLLVTFGIILNQGRENLMQHGDEAPYFLETVISVISKLVNTFLPKSSEKDKMFIMLHLKATSGLTKYYYQKLEENNDGKTISFENYLHMERGLTKMDKKRVVSYFCEYLAKCTKEEILLLVQNPNYRLYFSDAILVIIMSAIEQNNSFLLKFSLNNYCHLLQYSINVANQNVEELIYLLKAVIKLLKTLPPSFCELISHAVLPYLKKIIHNILQQNKELKTEVESEIRHLQSVNMDYQTLFFELE